MSQRSLIRAVSDIASVTFGSLCIISALPFVGIPFPTRGWADYYADKNQWLSQRSGGRLSPKGAGWVSAALRTAVGCATIYSPTRMGALLFNGAVVVRGTFLARQDNRPMRPQWTMLTAIGLCIVLNFL